VFTSQLLTDDDDDDGRRTNLEQNLTLSQSDRWAKIHDAVTESNANSYIFFSLLTCDNRAMFSVNLLVPGPVMY
jgi:hypothetical protein